MPESLTRGAIYANKASRIFGLISAAPEDFTCATLIAPEGTHIDKIIVNNISPTNQNTDSLAEKKPPYNHHESTRRQRRYNPSKRLPLIPNNMPAIITSATKPIRIQPITTPTTNDQIPERRTSNDKNPYKRTSCPTQRLTAEQIKKLEHPNQK